MIAFWIVYLGNILILTYLRFRTIKRINVLFTLAWCSILALSCLGLNNLRIPRMETNIYCFLFISTFNIVYLLNNNSKINDNKKIKLNIRYKAIYYINFISWIYMIPILFRAIKIINLYGYEAIREFTFTSNAMLVSGVNKFLSQVIIRGIFIATTVIAMMCLAMKEKNKKIIIISIIDIALYSFIFGGRYELFQMVIFYLVAVVGINCIIKCEKIKISFISIGIFVLAIFAMSELRGIDSFIKGIYQYFVAPISFLDFIFENKCLFDFNNNLYGAITFGFITEPITLVLKFLFNFNIDIASYYINIVTQNFYEINPGVYFNALTTAIYPFIRDFGFLGVIISPLFLGGAIRILEIKCQKTKNVLYYGLYIYLGYIIINTITGYDLMSYTSFVIMFFIIYFLTKREKIEGGEK